MLVMATPICVPLSFGSIQKTTQDMATININGMMMVKAKYRVLRFALKWNTNVAFGLIFGVVRRSL